MRHTDIAIIGGGIAGSTAAAMLGRAGIDALMVDPHPLYPPDFRCEKLDGSQVALLRETGLADAILPAVTPDGEVWVARRGRLVGRKRHEQFGFAYDTLVNAMRAAISGSAGTIEAKVTDIATTSDRQTVTLSDGQIISARLVVLANGLNAALRHNLGMHREEISRSHSISIGFDLHPLDRHAFRFPALTYGPERPSDRIAYLTLFPVGPAMRANLFVYRDLDDPFLRSMRHAPAESLVAALPGLRSLLGAFRAAGPVRVRPVDLYATRGYTRPGIVLVGDAFATSCPAAGTGLNKVFTDVGRLCGTHIPAWLRTDGMAAEKIATFYDDPLKTASDQGSLEKAFYLRALSTQTGLAWRARRGIRFAAQIGLGSVREAGRRFQSLPQRMPGAAASGTQGS